MAQIGGEATMRLRTRFIVDQLVDRRPSSPRLPRARVCLSEEEVRPYCACVAAGEVLLA